MGKIRPITENNSYVHSKILVDTIKSQQRLLNEKETTGIRPTRGEQMENCFMAAISIKIFIERMASKKCRRKLRKSLELVSF